jgi:SAM-dependent methyltransferase
MSTHDKWARQSETWERFTSPFTPHRDDTAIVERVAAELACGRDRLNAVMLGVTRETATGTWPAGTRLRAFDSSPMAIRNLWPRAGTPDGANAILADWSALPVESGEVDLVAADGALACLDFTDGVASVLAEIVRILRPDGRLAVRSFLRPDKAETIEAILADLHASRISKPAVLKIRVAAALHERGLAGISMRRFQQSWHEIFPDIAGTARQLGWPASQFDVLRNYDEQDLIVTYPTLEELRDAVTPHFRELECVFGSYELADRCPTLVLAPK